MLDVVLYSKEESKGVEVGVEDVSVARLTATEETWFCVLSQTLKIKFAFLKYLTKHLVLTVTILKASYFQTFCVIFVEHLLTSRQQSMN